MPQERQPRPPVRNESAPARAKGGAAARQNSMTPRARCASGVSAASKNESVGVGTFTCAPSRTPAPVRLSSSEGWPEAMSRCREAVPAALGERRRRW